ncbi:amino acid ABC transporter membrane protein, PAAT family (TC 3.A.1.3.-) [Gemmobacter aquatilis]|uniref:Amino acid ABC transporter membrane protein, PAAT family (TC 3.A.1.3.-) n=1 Tax=Gemmobacter aquatilis TaxID=933059 RepID=A0A1H8IXM5_9RHOB|nr:amino acid ABC transporter permease [Gemmobacter aquatilis]SEN72766.1 amino acid ABC transporter membrane protein, PAAT family (TC 3.A.1.3.-) [Gemmobacter aquatilis]
MPPSAPDKDFPWWLVALGAIGLWLFYEVWASPVYARVMATLAKGIWITLLVTVVGFFSAAVLGLALALAGQSRHVVLRQAARFYIEVVRGVPIIVLLLYVAFAATPALVWAWNATGLPEVKARDVSLLWRAVIALTIAYSAFLAEVFRAGLASVDKGQIEAAQALGLTGWLRFRLVVFPQAFRTILPPLGNDFVAMVKDSSLVSVLGVADVTQLGKVTAAGNFRYFETYNMVALIYLTMTLTLSLALRRLERRLRGPDAR